MYNESTATLVLAPSNLSERKMKHSPTAAAAVAVVVVGTAIPLTRISPPESLLHYFHFPKGLYYSESRDDRKNLRIFQNLNLFQLLKE